MSDSKKTPKKSAAKKSDHPKYIDMIQAAIITLKERNGTSRQAIVKYIKANYKVGDTCDVHVKLALKRGVVSGALSQPKGTGASGSFKVIKKEKPKPKPKAKAEKAVAKKPVSATKSKKAKSTPKKKTPAKKKASSAKKSNKKPAAAKKRVVNKKATKKSPAAKKPKTKSAGKKTKSK